MRQEIGMVMEMGFEIGIGIGLLLVKIKCSIIWDTLKRTRNYNLLNLNSIRNVFELQNKLFVDKALENGFSYFILRRICL